MLKNAHEKFKNSSGRYDISMPLEVFHKKERQKVFSFLTI